MVLIIAETEPETNQTTVVLLNVPNETNSENGEKKSKARQTNGNNNNNSNKRGNKKNSKKSADDREELDRRKIFRTCFKVLKLNWIFLIGRDS